jgi:hypothetical protein
MNTGMQDMINLGWKLALVMQGQAPAVLLDSYEQDRLPVLRHVLSGTETLTDVIGTGNAVVRGLLNHLGPWIGGTGLVQETAAAQMSQIALGYRDSPLSANHAHGGGLRVSAAVASPRPVPMLSRTTPTSSASSNTQPARIKLMPDPP